MVPLSHSAHSQPGAWLPGNHPAKVSECCSISQVSCDLLVPPSRPPDQGLCWTSGVRIWLNSSPCWTRSSSTRSRWLPTCRCLLCSSPSPHSPVHLTCSAAGGLDVVQRAERREESQPDPVHSALQQRLLLVSLQGCQVLLSQPIGDELSGGARASWSEVTLLVLLGFDLSSSFRRKLRSGRSCC